MLEHGLSPWRASVLSAHADVPDRTSRRRLAPSRAGHTGSRARQSPSSRSASPAHLVHANIKPVDEEDLFNPQRRIGRLERIPRFFQKIPAAMTTGGEARCGRGGSVP